MKNRPRMLDSGRHVRKNKAGKKDRTCWEKGVVVLDGEAREVKLRRRCLFKNIKKWTDLFL